MSATIGQDRKRQVTHERGATVLDGDLKDWVVVAIGTTKELESGVIGGYRMDIDKHCTNSCPGCR